MERGFVVIGEGEDRKRIPVISSLLIGRSVDCDISIDDAAASRHHVEIFVKEGKFCWRDLGSTNGTLINGNLMTEGVLQDGDRIQIGETCLRFEAESVPEAPDGEDSTLFATLLDGQGKVLARSPEDAKSEQLLRAVYTIMNQIASNYDPCSLVDQVLETSMKAIAAQRAAVLFADPSTDELLPCPVCHSFHIIQDGRLRKVDRGGVRVSSTVAHRVLAMGESVLYQDTQSAGDISSAQSVVSMHVRSIMCVPLRAKQKILGLLYVDTDKPGHSYTRQDMLLTTAVGNSAGLALENARMHLQVIEKERTDQEIQHAWSIQEGFLVHEWPQDDSRYRVYGETKPAKVVGGDFYDFVQPDKDRVGVLIGDVSGKGVPAALTMAQLLATFRLCVLRETSPAAVLSLLNTSLYKRSRFGMFCTVCFAVLDLKTGAVVCANAGHHPPLRVGKGGAELLAEASGPPIGVLPDASWTDSQLTLTPGDTLLLYTDGVVEARGMHTRRGTSSVAADEFGVRNLSRVAQIFWKESPKEMISGVNQSVREFTAPALPHDDCTMIAVRYDG
ncbi:MAG TPA: SpoIIE family protein phosphatase [Candidatus Hydrogenedentes bacterium]|nr:SpoIIE family protein phosphatase [Candidatus Hydrogenedentota bacterium]HOL77122.1 SpoIIE family protein phosphatase [Candidatus Hydrogenedentota bacterium]HPO86959.1 SpoIIE family protein phosphatase [Candidatus Hydrogenedentota bacterium]